VHDEIAGAVTIATDEPCHGRVAQLGCPPAFARPGDEDRRGHAVADLDGEQAAPDVDEQRLRIGLPGKGTQGVELDPVDLQRFAERGLAYLALRLEAERRIVAGIDDLPERGNKAIF
jgi:hypothetical protein